jgi:hypothetical protein
MSPRKNKSKPDNKNKPANKRIDWDLTVKLLAVIVSAATLGFGVYQYVVKPRRAAEDAVFSRKQDLYNQAMTSAAAFANAATQAEADSARKQFWTLYDGQLSSVESKAVKEAMQNFGGALKSWEAFNDPSDFTRPVDFPYFPNGPDKPSVSFNQLSYRLTQVCREDLGIK